jgi:hypothetical protein
VTIAVVPDVPEPDYGSSTGNVGWPRKTGAWKSLKLLSINKLDKAALVKETTIAPELAIDAFAVSHRGDRVAIAVKGAILLHDACFEKGQLAVVWIDGPRPMLRKHPHKTPITLLTFSPRSNYLVSGGAPPDTGSDEDPATEMPPAYVWRLPGGELHFPISNTACPPH